MCLLEYDLHVPCLCRFGKHFLGLVVQRICRNTAFTEQGVGCGSKPIYTTSYVLEKFHRAIDMERFGQDLRAFRSELISRDTKHKI